MHRLHRLRCKKEYQTPLFTSTASKACRPALALVFLMSFKKIRVYSSNDVLKNQLFKKTSS